MAEGRAGPGIDDALTQAEIDLRQFGVESYRQTGELYQHGYNAAGQAAANDLFQRGREAIMDERMTRAEMRAQQMDIAPDIDEQPAVDQLTGEQAAAIVAQGPNGNVRVTGAPPPQLPCRVLRYGSLRGTCGPDQQAHHIIPDYTKRYGTRTEGEKGLKRIPGLPGFLDGMAICMTGNVRSRTLQHGVAHAVTDKMMLGYSAQAGNPYPGTAPFNYAALAGATGAMAARPECAAAIAAGVNQELAGRRLTQLANANPAEPPVGPDVARLAAGQ